jgi:hypothetical protein
MNIGPEIASKKFAIFPLARRALSSGRRANLPAGRQRNERSPNAQMTNEGSELRRGAYVNRRLSAGFWFRHSFVIRHSSLLRDFDPVS